MRPIKTAQFILDEKTGMNKYVVVTYLDGSTETISSQSRINEVITTLREQNKQVLMEGAK